MPSLYDLHTHSLASDGTLTPTELVRRAQTAGVAVLALTDHDEVGGVAEAQAEAERIGITLIAGVEISVSWGGATVHMVGLGVDPDNPALNAGLAKLREFREWRADEIGRRLARHGIDSATEGARALAHGRVVGRTHFAQFLAANGHAESVRDVFKKFLKKNKPGYVSGEWAGLEEAIGWVKQAGGISAIAHPARYTMTATKRRKLLGEFIECGGDALEVVSGSHNRDETFQMAQLAKRYKLPATCGSDYHGPENPWVDLGRLPPLPEGVTAVWEAFPQIPDVTQLDSARTN